METLEEPVASTRTVPPSPSILSLFLQTPGVDTEPFQVAGFIKKLGGMPGIINMEFHCLASIAVELAALGCNTEPTYLISAELNMGKTEQKWEFENHILKGVNIDFVSEGTASVQVSFCKS